MMRTPTDRNAAWTNWRARLDGADIAISVDAPQCGLYRAKRYGRFVGVQIDLLQDIDEETGELQGEEILAAWINGEPADVNDAWTWCADHPITQAEFDRFTRMPAVRDLSREVIV